MGESILRDRRALFGSEEFHSSVYRKGIGLIFPNQEVDSASAVSAVLDVWQHEGTRRRRWKPWEELSFLFNTSIDRENGLSGASVELVEERRRFRVVWSAFNGP